MRTYSNIEATDLVKNSRATINNDLDSLRSNFSGAGTYTGVVGQIYHNATDDTWRAMKSDNTQVEICTNPSSYVRKTGTNTITGDMTVTGNITGGGFYYGTTPLVHEIKLGTTTCTNVDGVVTIPASEGGVKSVNGYLPNSAGAVTISAASARSTSTDLGLMSKAESTKLAGLSNYSLPTATSTTLGGVKIGSGITNSSGTISVPTATASVLGLVKIGTGINISNGIISALGVKSYSISSTSGYVVFYCGLQICWAISLTPTTSLTSFGTVTWTYPKSFSSRPAVFGSGTRWQYGSEYTDAVGVQLDYDSTNASQAVFYICGMYAGEYSTMVPLSGSDRSKVCLVAIGQGS